MTLRSERIASCCASSRVFSAVFASAAAGILQSAAAAQSFDTPIPLAASYATVLPPALADVDGDGMVDIVGVDAQRSTVFFNRRVIGSRFEPAQPLTLSLPPGATPRAVGADDLDGDGDLDLFVRARGSGPDDWLLVFERLGTGGFDPSPLEQHPLPRFPAFGNRFEFIDLDGDGATDIHFGNSSDQTTSLSRNGWIARRTGNSFTARILDAPGVDLTMALEDLTGNGLADAVIATRDGVYLRRQASGGSFAPSQLIAAVTMDGPAQQILFSDLDGDGDLDLITRDGFGTQVSAFENLDGAANFGNAIEIYRRATASDPKIGSLGALDLDSDGDMDLVSLLTSGASVWLERTGGFQFAPPAEVASAYASSFDPTAITFADLSGDGVEDVLYSSAGGRFARVSHQPIPGQPFLGESVEFVGGPALPLDSVATFDFEGDGDLDLAFSGADIDGRIFVSINKGPGRMEIPVPMALSQSGFSSVAAGDLDGDGDDDLVGYRSARAVLMENDGAGVFVPRLLHTSFQARPPALVLVDFDGDGDLDTLATRNSGRTLALNEQVSPGSFLGPRTVLSTNRKIVKILHHDFDGDGDLDITVGETTEDGNALSWYFERDSPYTFAPRVLAAGAGVEPTSIAWIDVTGDGTREVVWLNRTNRTVMARSLTAQGGLGAAFTVATVTGIPTSVVDVGSASMGGRDLVVGSLIQIQGGETSGRIEHLAWDSALGYGPATTVTEAVQSPLSLLTADLDQDGDLDLITAPELFWIPNLRVAPLGDDGCSSSVPNSTGRIGRLTAIGSAFVADNNVTLVGIDLPPSSLITYLCSLTPDEVPAAGGFLGTLCLGGSIGRFQAPGQAGLTSIEGRRDLELDLASFPQPMGSVAVMAGQRWYFQGWHRDSVGGTAVSNFTATTALVFR